MVQSLFLYLALPLLLIFWLLANFYRKIGIYIVGVIVANLYFLASSELVVRFYSKKLGIGLIGFDEVLKLMVNPYNRGTYVFLTLNFAHNKVYFIILWVLSILGLFTVIKRLFRKVPE